MKAGGGAVVVKVFARATGQICEPLSDRAEFEKVLDAYAVDGLVEHYARNYFTTTAASVDRWTAAKPRVPVGMAAAPSAMG